MATVVYLGDEWTAAGYRLAGADARVVDEARASAAFERALAEQPTLLLIDAGLARVLDADRLERARSALAPPIAVVEDAAGHQQAESMTARVRRRMGVAQ
ncbi:MAG: V-type ATP synthase subunit F [Wenzhouxiangellaceae bacterium]|nr:V-type ATP synthase subunit F [Wenzhouxiangellaceae bacterium]